MDVNLIYKEFGRRLRHARKTAKLTQEMLAEQVGLNRTSITNIENGRQRIPLHLLFSLATIVGVHPTSLLPKQRETYKPDVIDRKLLERALLKPDQMDYVQTLIISGLSGKK